jgi:DNA repair exonuclease SbcCD nuclease subunit
MKIAIVGDPHISTGFRGRADDYLKTVLRKIEDIAKENDKVIFLGDLFDTSALPIYVFNETYKVFKRYPDKFHTILGNHDTFHRNLKALNKTTIGSLNLTSVLQIHVKPFDIDNVTFVPVLVDDDIEKIDKATPEKKEILLGHKYFELFVCPEESFERDQLERLNYDLVFLGHDHVPYEPLIIGNTTLYRPGSLTRTTTDLYNKDRKIRYYQLDTETMDVDEKEVQCLPSSEVFLKGSFDKQKDKVVKTDSGNLAKLLAKIDRQTVSKLSLSDTLRKLGGTEEEVQYIRELHLTHNISFN